MKMKQKWAEWKVLKINREKSMEQKTWLNFKNGPKTLAGTSLKRKYQRQDSERWPTSQTTRECESTVRYTSWLFTWTESRRRTPVNTDKGVEQQEPSFFTGQNEKSPTPPEVSSVILLPCKQVTTLGIDSRMLKTYHDPRTYIWVLWQLYS